MLTISHVNWEHMKYVKTQYWLTAIWYLCISYSLYVANLLIEKEVLVGLDLEQKLISHVHVLSL